ncbi:ABC-three component system protein [Methylobacterium sp. A52T]
MPISSPTPKEILLSAGNPADPGLYFIGPHNRRITFYSQQVRALRLAQAMDTLSAIKAGEKVAIVGAGAAGATLATALALLGRNVTLYDPALEILQLQSASTRLLHPHIYEWPMLGSLDDRAGLPILDWKAGNAGEVCASLRSEFAKMLAALPDLTFKPNHRLSSLAKAAGGWRLSLQSADSTEDRLFQHVILAMGFGEEKSCGAVTPEDYWRPSAIGTPATEPEAGAKYVVSGNGDGALTEVLGLLITDFEHVAFTRRFLGLFRDDDLRVAALQVYDGVPPDHDVEHDLNTKILPTLVLHGAIDALRNLVRKDRMVTLNSSGTLFPAGKAAQLNQCMVAAVLEAARREGITVRRTSGYINDVKGAVGSRTVVGTNVGSTPDNDAYKHVILRHGPDLAARYAPAADQLIAYGAHLKPLLVAYPELASPPAMTLDCFELFEKLRIEKTADHASKPHQLQIAEQNRHVVEVIRDAATRVVLERGNRTLDEIAADCETLPHRVTIRLHIPPSEVTTAEQLVKLARCSDGLVELAAHPEVRADWQALLPTIGAAPNFSSVRPARELSLAAFAGCVDQCLVRALDERIADTLKNGKSPMLGEISNEILAKVGETWAAWRIQLDGDAVLRFDFLRWLAHVDQDPVRPWDGDRACIDHLSNALIMAMAAHQAVPFVPISVEDGNLQFAANAVALGSGCDRIGSEPIAIRSEPDEWGVDALILSASSEVEVRNAAGRVMDGGIKGMALRTARRVSPAIIQNDRKWRLKLKGDLSSWLAAVDEEFQALRDRQDAELEELAK